MAFEINKSFARIIGIMLESRLIWYKHYYLWCDEVIEHSDNPPFWIIELATVKYCPKAAEIVNIYAFSEPFEQFDDRRSDLYVACLFLRYERREISWATFLLEAGDFTDGYGGKEVCDFFYHMLNKYEDSDYSIDIERAQSLVIMNTYTSDINDILEHYNFFKPYYRKYIENGQNSDS